MGREANGAAKDRRQDGRPLPDGKKKEREAIVRRDKGRRRVEKQKQRGRDGDCGESVGVCGVESRRTTFEVLKKGKRWDENGTGESDD